MGEEILRKAVSVPGCISQFVILFLYMLIFLGALCTVLCLSFVIAVNYLSFVIVLNYLCLVLFYLQVLSNLFISTL
ncbi:hypothetical protein MIMGU_mgv1a017430mg [Erythranthe guttata]|uniref:Uncharacterized protein n=1 Tax=Erythranthe guttata TaxID=4155 RepID=A0A022RL28_ERYGU|nr:hypothetical protein MIMGU_mgv1a017430mg [Erythranthe guttata]